MSVVSLVLFAVTAIAPLVVALRGRLPSRVPVMSGTRRPPNRRTPRRDGHLRI